MKKQQKKAFTLVELLVVIAILAILASVAVVGYTAFIKNAAVSNDENVATQLTRYLEALQADSTSKYYNKDITAGDVRELTKYILEESGSTELVAESAKYGYDFYFDLDKDEYIVDKTENVRNVARNVIMGANAAETDVEVRLENSFTQSFRYFLASTGGSELAELVNDFYALGNLAADKDIVGAIKELKDKADGTDIEAQMENLVVFTNDAISTDSKEPSVVVVVDGITKVTAPSADVDLKNISVITLPNSVVAIEENALSEVETVVMDKTPEEVSKMSTGSFAGSMELKGEKCTSEGTKITTSAGVEITYDYSNKFEGFTVNKVSVNHKKIVETETNTVIFITPEITNGEIVVDVDYKANDPDMPILGISDLVWTLEDEKGNAISDAKLSKVTDTRLLIKFDEKYTLKDKYVLVATANSKEYKYELRVQKLTAGNVTLSGQTLKTGTNNITLVTKSDTEKFKVAELAYTITNKLDDVRLFNDDITMTCTGDGFSFDNQKDEFIVENPNKGTIKGTLTIKVGSYLTFDVNLTVVDARNFAVQPKNPNITVLGNGNSFNVSELFELKGAFPEGTKLVVYTGGEVEGNTYMAFDPLFFEYAEITAGEEGDKVVGNKFAVTSDNFSKIVIKFTKDSGANSVKIAFMHNGVRISEDVIVKVVDGYNVRNYADFTSKVNTENTAYPLTSNVVFLNNITMSGDVNFLQIPADKTLYGNGFKFDITSGRKQEEGIINLKGTLRDVMVVGAVYSTFSFSAGDDYGSSAVNATGNAYIYNSYIANTRSPLRTSGAGVVIEDSVLFGGRYSNIDMTGGTITIKGTVTTVQQVYSDKNVIGMGVSAWFNDSKKNVVIEEGANFVQYNFMDESIKQYLPKLALMGYDIMDLKEPFNAMFNDTATYGQYMITAANGNKYVNSGIISTDKYSLAYTIGGDEPGGFLGIGASYAKGAKKIVKTTTAVGDDEKFIIVHDTRLDPSVGTPISAGYVEVTGAQLKAGVEFVFNTKVSSNTNAVPYLFQVQSDDYLTINVTGGTYSALDYSFDKDMSSTLGLVESLSNSLSLHSRGIHYGKMCVGVNTPVSTAYAYGTTTYQQLLEQYIEMTDGDGTKDNFYAPENFQFVNGSVSNYWD